MENLYSVLEIAGSGVKLLVGYLFQHRFYVLHALESTAARLSKGQIADREQTVNGIKEVVNSASRSLGFQLREVVLLLPPVNLTIGSETGSTNTVSKDNVVLPFDVTNAFSIIGKKIEVPEKTIIDIVPYNFIYDSGQQNRYFLSGITSRSITVQADVSLIDQAIYESFTQTVRAAGLAVLRTILAPAAAVSLIASYNVAGQFLLVDLGASLTTLSLGSDGRLLRSEVLSWGSEDITSALAERFKIDRTRAAYFKNVFGLSRRPDFEFAFEEGLSVEDISAVVTDCLEPLVEFIRAYIVKFEIPELYPIMLSGGGADLFGLDRFLSAQFQTKVMIYTPEVFGARNKAYTNCVAALKYIDLYPTVIQKRKGNDFTLTRVDSRIVDPKAPSEDGEIL